MEKKYTKLDIIMILIYSTIAIFGIVLCMSYSVEKESMHLDHFSEQAITGQVKEFWSGNRSGSGRTGAGIAFGIISATCIYLIHSILYKKSE